MAELYVVRLDICVNNSLPVNVRHGMEQLKSDITNLRERHVKGCHFRESSFEKGRDCCGRKVVDDKMRWKKVPILMQSNFVDYCSRHKSKKRTARELDAEGCSHEIRA